MDLNIYLYQNICTHSVTESKTHDLVIVFILLQRHSVTLLARVDSTPCRKKRVSCLLIYPKCVLLMS